MVDFEKASHFWDQTDIHSRKMPREKLIHAIEEILDSHTTCALATQHRCTPVEYVYRKGKFYILTEGGKKFSHLKEDPQVAIAIYKEFTGFAQLEGIQVEGVAQACEPGDPLYEEVCTIRGMDVEAMVKRITPLYGIVVTVTSFDVVCSAFQKEGYFVRQHITFE